MTRLELVDGVWTGGLPLGDTCTPSTPRQSLRFFVPGVPAPGGSKKFVGLAKSTGRAILIDAAGAKNKNWRSSVAQVAAGAMSGKPQLTAALAVSFTFFMPRPKAHLRTNGAVKPKAPRVPVTKPDVIKLARSTEDAMTSIVYRDDSQTVDLVVRKRYADDGPAGCEVLIEWEAA